MPGLDKVLRLKKTHQSGSLPLELLADVLGRVLDPVVNSAQGGVVGGRARVIDDRVDEFARRHGFLLDLGLLLLVGAQARREALFIRRVLHFGDGHAPHCKCPLQRSDVRPRQMAVSGDVFCREFIQEMADGPGHDHRKDGRDHHQGDQPAGDADDLYSNRPIKHPVRSAPGNGFSAAVSSSPLRPGGRGETIIARQFAKYREMLARPLDRDQGRKRPLANLALITYCLDLLLCKITSIAFANPSSSFEAVTRVACRLTSSAALSIANERPLTRNIGRSFCMSPTVATASVETPRRCAIVRTKVPLSLPGGVMSR